MRRRLRKAQDLRFAVECLPRTTREAMLEGVRSEEIIVGAYTDRNGGMCPMLAAHRHGGRTSFASFARAWDRYTGSGTRPRPATPRELRTLEAMLEGSLLKEDSRTELAQAAADLRAAKARRAAAAAAEARTGVAAADGRRARRRRDTGERDRSAELGRRPGWAWLRVFRRYDEYEAALDQVESAAGDAPSGRELEDARR